MQKIDYDFFSPNTSGYDLLSHIIRSKLPKNIIIEIGRRTAVTYPKINDIFPHFFEIRKLFLININDQNSQSNSNKNNNNSNVKSVPRSSNVNSSNSGANSSSNPKGCKFCSMTNHGSSKCQTFSSHSARVDRAKNLKLCSRCLSASHDESKCPGLEGRLSFSCAVCRRAEHVTPLCPQFVLSTFRNNQQK